MTDISLQSLSVIVERDMPFPPEKIWRALTTPHLIEEWLMKNDFRPAPNQAFTLSGDWGAVACKILELEPNASLVYSWAAFGLESTVTWTLTPTPAGTRLRMEQAGFKPDQTQFYQGAAASWPGFVTKLEQVVERMA